MFVIGIHPDRNGEKFFSRWKEYFESKNVKVQRLDLTAVDVMDQAKKCDGIMWRFTQSHVEKHIAKQMLPVFEKHLEIPVFPNLASAWHYDEKVSQYYLLESIGAPIAKTWVFWNYDVAVRWAENVSFPVIFKMSVGAGSANVIKVDTRKKAIELLDKMFHQGVFPSTDDVGVSPQKLITQKFRKRYWDIPQILLYRTTNALKYVLFQRYPPLRGLYWRREFGYAYFQEFLPGNQFDTRVTVIGNRAFAYKRMNRNDDFRASGSGEFDTDPAEIDLNMVKTALDISHRLGFQSMAYDFLRNDKGDPLLIEISYTYVDWMVQACPGYWDRDLNWKPGQMWPQDAIGEDFLKLIKDRKHNCLPR